MLAAARNWSQLASDLGAATENIGAVLEALTEVWQGPAAIRMAEAALSYRAWLVEVSNLAEATAKLTRRTRVPIRRHIFYSALSGDRR
ncbi:PPE family protein [Mycobacterium haemophilum DSM 44634]|uniref:PPE domain-containing protein n=1 Tax=Mycobacterium haemophilum TaxID=29311 RepID=UPI0006D3D75A|nr:PPE domain-containing protein [Mycobacterium haemophilum]ALL56311.1 hypothetical protein B586_07260 [Mycobacterium haemophilum DSM 44634]MCV7341409.1 PPE domain-containing protein [Mycobacterium haemophilum DSM 44634]